MESFAEGEQEACVLQLPLKINGSLGWPDLERQVVGYLTCNPSILKPNNKFSMREFNPKREIKINAKLPSTLGL